MKPSSRFFYSSALLTLLCGLQLAAFAQDPAPISPPSAAIPSEPAPVAAPAADPERDGAAERSALRRLDEPEQPPRPRPRPSAPSRRDSGDVPFGDHTVPAGSRTREVVSILGSSSVDGEVARDVVSIRGDTRIGPDARVGGSAIAILGKLDVQGRVDGDAVNVFGGTRINSHVRGEVVAVMGNMDLGPSAIIDGDVVVVGGRLTKDPAAILRGDQVYVPALAPLGDLDWLTTWFSRALLTGRPLAYGESMGWAWVVALSFLGLYLLLALIFPRGIEKCATTLETRPGYSILASILTVVLTPVAFVLLTVTLVGIFLVPFFAMGLFFVKLFGKAVMLAWIGRRVIRLFGPGGFGHAVVAVAIGGVIVLFLYTVPVFGIMLYKVLSWLGVGVVVYTIALGFQRDQPPAVTAGAPSEPPPPSVVPEPAPIAAVPVAPVSPVAPESVSGFESRARAVPTDEARAGFPGMAPGAASVASFTVPGETPGSSGSSGPAAAPVPPIFSSPPPPSPPPPPIMPSAATLPRAGLAIRLGALFIDLILVGVVVGFSSGLLPRFIQFDSGPPVILPLLAAYGAVMWKLKGTTIGGIIFGLKVVRMDGREMDWPTAVVRALSCFLSLIVVGLGFLWVAIDEERQSWHDKIAGTTVVRVPKGVSLL
jgi:uncharacterized RDD family membrane protein YckC